MSDLKQQIEQALINAAENRQHGILFLSPTVALNAIWPLIEATLPPVPPPSAETWPRIIAERDGLRLQQTQPPNSYLDVIRISDGKELVSQPCVVTEPKDDIIFLLLHAWKAALSSPRRAGEAQETQRDERCICAAVKLANGFIVRGHRHNDCLRTIWDAPAYKQVGGNLRGESQGFLTTRGRFVTRREGLDLQLLAGIQSARGHYQNELYSEDLY